MRLTDVKVEFEIPDSLHRFLATLVANGHFDTLDEAIRYAVFELQDHWEKAKTPPEAAAAQPPKRLTTRVLPNSVPFSPDHSSPTDPPRRRLGGSE